MVQTGCGENVGDAGGDDSRLAGEPVDDGAVEGVGRSIGRVLLEGQLIAGDQNVVGTEAGIDSAHLLEAAQERAGHGEQHQGDGDLRDDQGGAQPGMA